jgi:hypothetical protein
MAHDVVDLMHLCPTLLSHAARCCLPAATVDLIAQNGFDFRLSQVAAYGNGLYFAGA